ncbi:MAG TPA: hypothetical protein DCS82_13690 [Rhodospirillaceae bacterium]|nr:hypothetical protein [Rhodospirillaceae bacterium]HAA92368.1 hypothetical protein [Rhodospirillaceae bacterium]HAT36762.1 hypothetical protein [Rhodospirillaceae bacterium]|tara:strand:- start:67 stop:267 length:201 start_codon:yes stop_codon:yes gene_type:complete
MLQESNVNDNATSIEDQLQSLKSKHSQLDTELKKEQERPHPDDLAISRLKREKLAVKDQISRLSQN